MMIARGLLLGGFACVVLPARHSARPTIPATASTPSTEAVARGQIRRRLINKQPAADLPGWETRLYLIEYGPAAVAPLHVHPVVGVGLVLDGAFESAFGDEPVVQIHTGQGFVDPAGIAHRVFRNTSRDDELRFVIAYTIKAGRRSSTGVRHWAHRCLDVAPPVTRAAKKATDPRYWHGAATALRGNLKRVGCSDQRGRPRLAADRWCCCGPQYARSKRNVRCSLFFGADFET